MLAQVNMPCLTNGLEGFVATWESTIASVAAAHISARILDTAGSILSNLFELHTEVVIIRRRLRRQRVDAVPAIMRKYLFVAAIIMSTGNNKPLNTSAIGSDTIGICFQYRTIFGVTSLSFCKERRLQPISLKTTGTDDGSGDVVRGIWTVVLLPVSAFVVVRVKFPPRVVFHRE